MKIIKDQTINVVLFVGDNLTLDGHAKGDGWEARRVTDLNAVLEDITEAVPDDYAPGCYTYNNGWALTSAGTNAKTARDAQQLADAKVLKMSEMLAEYETAISANIDYMSTTFKAAKEDRELLSYALAPGSAEPGDVWFDSNDVQVPVTFADLQGLAQAMMVRGRTHFLNLKAKEAAIHASDLAGLDLITWA